MEGGEVNFNQPNKKKKEDNNERKKKDTTTVEADENDEPIVQHTQSLLTDQNFDMDFEI